VGLRYLQELLVEARLVAYMVTVGQEALLILGRGVRQPVPVVLVAMVETM
jgi:hypothetical protein